MYRRGVTRKHPASGASTVQRNGRKRFQSHRQSVGVDQLQFKIRQFRAGLEIGRPFRNWTN